MPSVRRKNILYVGIALTALIVGGVAITTGMQYRKTVLKARESVLIDNLAGLRTAVKKYTLEQELAPQSLDDLVKAGYVRDIPSDPITGKKDWRVTQGEVERASKKVNGIVDVHSASAEKSSIGSPYNQW